MSSYEDTISPPEWPYPVNYGKETEVDADVLVLGGGLAGSYTAINAAKKGVNVVIVDKAPVIRSGSAGAGIDHWHNACTNPCSKMTPEELIESGGAHGRGMHTTYITCKEGYDALLELEKMGVPIRDVDDEFKGAPFRDDATKLMFAYDYENKYIIRLSGGANLKPALYNELKRLGVNIYAHVMVTSLLTEGGQQGARVVGATGVNVRTGEFYVFKSKATVLSTGGSGRLWAFSTELQGFAAEHGDPNCAGDGHAMAWKAGAELTNMEGNRQFSRRYPVYGTGNPYDTWFACSIVDANGKEIPWVNKDGKILTTVSERYKLVPGQQPQPRGWPTTLVRGLGERIRKGEFVLPLYADLAGMPKHERRAIWGLMIGNEGKTRIVYKNYNEAGFDPDTDMLLATVMLPELHGVGGPWWGGIGHPLWRSGGGSLVVDWDLKTNLEGLFAAGGIGGGGGCAGASSTGRYVGRKVADYAKTARDPVIERKQVEEEKARVYAPVNREDGVGWKELQAGLCRIMQDYCGEYKSESILKMGLWWLNSIRESEGSRAYARNPHELWRTLECFVRLSVGEMIMHASLARKASSSNFKRLDYPEMNPPEWNKFITIKQERGKVKIGELPTNFLLLPPNATTYEANYKEHCGL